VTFIDYVRAQHATLLRFAIVLTGERGLAEDVVQNALSKAYQRWTHIQSAQEPHAYIRRMILNEYLSWRRKWQRVVAVGDLGTLLPLVADHAERHAERVALLEQVQRLPKQQRAAVVLRYYESLSDPEIANVLGCAESTVRSNIARALATMRVQAQVSGTEPAGTGKR
jgi:RNA polymerase sigma-70 factor (sigma-E family)